MSKSAYLISVKKFRFRVLIISATALAALFPTFAPAAQGNVSAQVGANCEMELGDKKVVRGRLDVPGLSQARLRCGTEVYDAGLAHKIDGAVHQKSGNRLMLIEAPVGQKMLIFRKPSATSTGKEKHFGQFEVIEQDMKRAIVSLKAFEERGDVVIWRRGGP